MPEPIRRDITKEEVARRQIDRAIIMHFEDDDAICTHVLAYGAAQVVWDTCRNMGLESSQKKIESALKPDKIKYFWDVRTNPYNFSKHANPKNSTVLEYFNEAVTDMILLQAVMDFQLAFKHLTVPMVALFNWMVALNRDCMDLTPEQRMVADTMEDFRTASRAEQKRMGLGLIKAVKLHIQLNPNFLDHFRADLPKPT